MRRENTLLYVEDNPANLRLVEQIIARHPNLRLLTAVDGNSGIELARQSQPGVILMDINLPGISGIQALNILREDPATAHIPIIALSANAMPLDVANGLQAGFFRYLTKPIKIDELMNALYAALEGTPSEPLSIAGVDVQEAHARLGISREALERLLARFAEDLPRGLAVLAAAVAARDHDAVRLHAHSLSGSAGSLAVDRLRWAAAALESAGHARGELDELFAAVEAEARTVLASLAPLRAPQKPATGRAPSATQLLALARCLSSGDVVAITAKLATLDAAGGDELARLRVLIRDYQYESAAALIAEIT
jgi:CheY-like chemotaxis protein